MGLDAMKRAQEGVASSGLTSSDDHLVNVGGQPVVHVPNKVIWIIIFRVRVRVNPNPMLAVADKRMFIM